ncbi:uncharacterized protein G2W53_037072 [Senna tora]|uniref:Uncharacterized protein n=1 Tax=Senna tora TaxID=362788 RepID=A0A834T5U3_9FABA|nr:uncharacterized protein G2W53_037072 [Senna tora]
MGEYFFSELNFLKIIPFNHPRLDIYYSRIEKAVAIKHSSSLSHDLRLTLQSRCLTSLQLGHPETFHIRNPNHQFHPSINASLCASKFLFSSLTKTMASTAIIKRKGSDTSSAITKRPKLFLDNLAKGRFESDFRTRGICAPREVNFEFFAKEPELNIF